MSVAIFITGINGQDGAYLSKHLLDLGETNIIGITRRSGSGTNWRHQELGIDGKIKIEYCDITEANLLNTLFEKYQPKECYHLAAQSFVKSSFDNPYTTINSIVIGTLKLLESIRHYSPKTKFYNAASSEMFGRVLETPQSETTPFNPVSQYGVSKVSAFQLTKVYQESYGLFACSGILFNHESPIRPDNFVTRKITKAAVRIKEGLQEKLYLGNLNAKRDWGFAGDYAEAMWLMLQHDKPDDYVISTGEPHSVKDFVEFAFCELGIEIVWEGEGLDKKGRNAATGEILIEVDPQFFRPIESSLLVGDPSKAREKLGWAPRVSFEELVKMMVKNDLEFAKY